MQIDTVHYPNLIYLTSGEPGFYIDANTHRLYKVEGGGRETRLLFLSPGSELLEPNYLELESLGPNVSMKDIKRIREASKSELEEVAQS